MFLGISSFFMGVLVIMFCIYEEGFSGFFLILGVVVGFEVLMKVVMIVSGG